MTSPLRSVLLSMLAPCVAVAACAGDTTGGTAGDTGTSGDSGDPSATTAGSLGSEDAGPTTSPGTDADTSGTSSPGTDATTAETEGSTDTGAEGSTTGIIDEPNVLYVRSDGADGNPGTSDAPMRTIQWALATAGASEVIDTIRVAEGAYGYDFANADHLVLVEGVALLGGYRDDWGQRDPATYVTSIVDETTDGVATSLASPHRAVEVPADVTAATVLEGFHIGAAHGEYRTAVWALGAATIRNNAITVDIVDGQYQWGIYIDGADAQVTGNRVGYSGPEGIAIAIEVHDSDAAVANNILDLTGLDSYGVGVRISLGAPTLVANTIAMSDSGQAVGILYDSGATPAIENNLIETVGDNGVCLRQNGEGDPMSVRNNVLECQYTLHRINVAMPGSYTSIAGLEGVIASAQDNVEIGAPIVLGHPDFVLDGTTPCSVARGGLDVAAEHPEDIDGLARTVPLSIGAHEWDGACP